MGRWCDLVWTGEADILAQIDMFATKKKHGKKEEKPHDWPQDAKEKAAKEAAAASASTQEQL